MKPYQTKQSQPYQRHKKRNKRNPVGLLVLLGVFLLLAVLLPQDARTPSESNSGDSITTIGPNTPDSPSNTSELSADTLRVHVLDVGQGLSVLIQTKDAALLYDGGGRETAARVVSYLQKQGVERLDYCIASHYDSDHLYGVIAVLNAFDTDTLITPDYEADTTAYHSFLQTAADWGVTITRPDAVLNLPLGQGCVTVLPPVTASYEDENDYSLVLRADMGDTSLLLAGDASVLRESEILSGDNFESVADVDVLIPGHHGSSDSTSKEFLKTVAPKCAIISCGLHNDYGHPHRETMELLDSADLALYRTDLQGNIIFTMTGTDIVFDLAPCEEYGSGWELANISSTESSVGTDDADISGFPYILNTNSRRFHLPDCDSVPEISPGNRQGTLKSKEALTAAGYKPCGTCKP